MSAGRAHQACGALLAIALLVAPASGALKAQTPNRVAGQPRGRTAPQSGDRATAQSRDRVTVLAAILAGEDARRLDSALVTGALRDPDPLVRRRAALAAARVGDRRMTRLIAARLRDADAAVQADAAFALGLLADPVAVDALVQRLTQPPAPDSSVAAEAVTALAKMPGDAAPRALGELLDRTREVPGVTGARAALASALLEAWRLGDRAPVPSVIRYARDQRDELRWRAFYSLARLRSPAAAAELAAGLDDRHPLARAAAARALTQPFADRTGLNRRDLAVRLARAAADPDPGVRVSALLALGTYRDSARAVAVVPLLADSGLNVRVQAATAMGQLRGFAAAAALAKAHRDPAQPWAVRREALLGLARADTALLTALGRTWRESTDWRERAAAAEAWVIAKRSTPNAAAPWLTDPEPRVVAWGLQAWLDAESQGAPAPALVAAARALLPSADAAVRSLAADVLTRAPHPSDIPQLVAMYRATGSDSFPQAALSALKALAAVAQRSDSARAAVQRDFVEQAPRPDDYLLRLWAERNWPELSRRWGPAYPIATGHDDRWYEAIVRRFLLGSPAERSPHVVFETEAIGPVEVELLGADAPITVAHFLDLVDAGFFNGNRWHRVVPNFVVQDGDPRGDGWGGPPGAIRDEINRVRYAGAVLGMALDGPDTGNSQWFVNLSPQPHLDGTYTAFGRVVRGGGAAALGRITQGGRIVTIRRAPAP
jgi:cyclophilin family peptidyl-prolyl cis-trans isomerase/HEAT repeat protein